MKPYQKSPFSWLGRLDYRVVIIGLILAYYVFYWGTFKNFILDIDHCSLYFCDFQLFYYYAGKAVLAHTQLPNGFYYSNFAAILFAPFALFPLLTSSILWGIVQVITVAFLFLLPNVSLLKDKTSKYLYTILLFTSAPLLNNFKWGQVSALIVLFIFWAFFLYAKGKHFSSALVLGAIISIKFFPAIFLLYFVFRRDWKYLFICLMVVLVCLILIPMLVLGPDHALQFLVNAGESATQMVTSLAAKNTGTQYFAGIAARHFGFSVDSALFKIFTLFGYLLVIPILYQTYKAATSHFEDAAIWCCCLIFMTIPFWIPSAWPHYFVFLPIVQIMVFQKLAGPEFPRRKIVFLLWSLSIIFSSILAAQAVQGWFTYVWMGLIFWSNLVVLLLTLFVLQMNSKRATLVSA